MAFALAAVCYSFFLCTCVQIVPQQQGTVVRPQVTLTQSPMLAIRGQAPNRIIVGQVVKQMPAGVGSTSLFFCKMYFTHVKFMFCTITRLINYWIVACMSQWETVIFLNVTFQEIWTLACTKSTLTTNLIDSS